MICSAMFFDVNSPAKQIFITGLSKRVCILDLRAAELPSLGSKGSNLLVFQPFAASDLQPEHGLL